MFALAWEENWFNLATIIGFPEDTPCPPCPRAEYITLGASTTESEDSTAAPGSKRKAPTNDESVKKTRGEVEGTGAGHRIFTALRAIDLQPPKLPTAEEVEAAILQRQKQELLKEYV